MNVTAQTLLNILLTFPNSRKIVLLTEQLERYNADHEIDIDRPLNIYGGPQSVTLLTYFINNDYTDAVRLLLEHGANPNIGQVRGIHCATMRNNPDMIDILAHYGADLNATDPDGHTALYLSIFHNKTEATACLMGKEIDVNKSLSGRTPIIEATIEGNFNLVKALYEKGANPSVSEDICWGILGDIERDHADILDIAEYMDHRDIAAYLYAQIDLAGE